MNYLPKRSLDPFITTVTRNGTQENISFTDLTLDEQTAVLDGLTDSELKSQFIKLANTLRAYGDLYNLSMNDCW